MFGDKAGAYGDTQGEIELFARNEPADDGSQRMSIVGVSGDWVTSDRSKNTAANTTRVLDIKSGNPQKMAVPGLIYAPSESVGLAATNDDVVARNRGRHGR